MFSKTTQLLDGKNLLGKIQTLLPIAYLFPFFSLIELIRKYSVNVPFGDEWILVELFRKVFVGEVEFNDFFAPHNEHRIFFPKLIFVALAFLSRWDVRYGMYLSAFLALLTFILICIIAYQQTNRKDSLFHLTNFFTSIVIFSFIQSNNWLTYLQSAWFLLNLCLVICIFFLTLQVRSLWFKVGLGALSCFVASFTLAHGLMTWIAAIPSLLVLPKDTQKSKQILQITIIWTTLFIICSSIFFYDYHQPRGHSDLFFFFKEPLTTSIHFFRLMGGSIAYQSEYSFAFGCMLFANFLLFFVLYIRKYNSRLSKDLAPWISIGLFTILFEFMTTIGRASFGVEQAYSPRYTTVSILLIICLIHSWRSISAYREGLAWQSIFVASLLTFFNWFASTNSIGEAERWQAAGRYGQACLELVNHVDRGLDQCLTSPFFPRHAQAKKMIKTLNQIGFRRDPKNIDYVVNSSKNYGNFDVPETNTSPLLIQKKCLNCVNLVDLIGWAILPKQRKAARLVLISYSRDANDNPGTFISTAYVNVPSLDISKALNSKRYSHARWVARVSTDLLPPGETVVKAWVYDPKNKQLVKLPGQAKVRVEK